MTAKKPSAGPKGLRHRTEAARLWFSPLALCRASNLSVDAFYPKPNAAVPARVARLCAACPVREECLETAMAEENGRAGRYGIRGGLTAWERRKLHSKRTEAARKLAAAQAAAA